MAAQPKKKEAESFINDKALNISYLAVSSSWLLNVSVKSLGTYLATYVFEKKSHRAFSSKENTNRVNDSWFSQLVLTKWRNDRHLAVSLFRCFVMVEFNVITLLWKWTRNFVVVRGLIQTFNGKAWNFIFWILISRYFYPVITLRAVIYPV